MNTTDKKVLTGAMLRMVQEYRDQRCRGDDVWKPWTKKEEEALGVLVGWCNLPSDMIA